MSKWRHYVPALKQLITSSESYVRDPYAVTILTIEVPVQNAKKDSKEKTVFKGLGFSKRVRYAMMRDDPDPDFAQKLSTERAYKDLYKQMVGELKPLLDDLTEYPLDSPVVEETL